MPGFLEAIKKPFVIKRLKKEYKMLYGSTDTDAEQSLQRQLNYIKSKHPNQTEEWYLKKIIYDLEKDRSRGR
ncbi:MAG: hypothetical protein GXY49_04140 [Syntrophomonadaceae bacterium]|nr:hypothetical protein [Syntrophomonadaceae bacterium]